jgi:hypothetical protein
MICCFRRKRLVVYLSWTWGPVLRRELEVRTTDPPTNGAHFSDVFVRMCCDYFSVKKRKTRNRPPPPPPNPPLLLHSVCLPSPQGWRLYILYWSPLRIWTYVKRWSKKNIRGAKRERKESLCRPLRPKPRAGSKLTKALNPTLCVFGVADVN